jgi:hypothetical protein
MAVFPDKLFHARIPELLNMIRHRTDRIIIGFQIFGDLVGHVHKTLDRIHSAGTSVAIRRERSDSASYSSCQSVGPLDALICTAVTLYSGQLVAQSL